jgi:glycosyltransferase involved in cell wall biosynthesis
MACLIKAPDASGKGCVTFTTPERDQVMKKNPAARAAVEALKSRYVVGLHHNWHDHDFTYDALFDFSMAGDGDLIERDGKPFDRIALDACNFAPDCFARKPGTEKFWDVLSTSRAVFFKGLPEFFQAIRTIYDTGRFIRVLHLCPVPPANKEGTHLHDIRQRFEAMFSSEERRFFNLMTMEWDNPFPLDLETLAFFYRSSGVYVHSAPNERRARAGAYAWATGMPLVSRENIASILPEPLRRRPFWFEYDEPAQMADAILAAVDSEVADRQWDDVANEFSTCDSARRLEVALQALARRRGETLSSAPINPLGFDLRLGRHHEVGGGTNQVDQSITIFCKDLLTLPSASLAEFVKRSDPELAMAERFALESAKANSVVRVRKERIDGFRKNLKRLFVRE